MYKLAILFAAATISTFSSATVIYDEAALGDLSNDPLAPTSLTFGVGSNEISGTVVTSNDTSNDTRDYFTFTIGDGLVLDSIDLVSYFDVDGNPADDGFTAINAGTTTTQPGMGSVDADFLGGAHVGADQLPGAGGSLAADLARAENIGTTFDFPLTAGDYSFLIQQTGPENTGYTLDFVVSPVPLPAAVWLFVSGLLGLFGVKRMRSSS